ncbi:hypothetical protein WJX77_002194 [Trebouxia sp. C0004]
MLNFVDLAGKKAFRLPAQRAQRARFLGFLVGESQQCWKPGTEPYQQIADAWSKVQDKSDLGPIVQGALDSKYHQACPGSRGRYLKFSVTLGEPSSLFRHAAYQRYVSAPAVRKALIRSTDPAEDAACMARALDLIMTRSSPQAQRRTFDVGQLAGKEALELLGSGPSPRVALPFRNKEPDFAWIPADLAAMDAALSVVLEVAVFNESDIELLDEGSEWLDLPDVQAAILVKVFHEDSPINDCPEIHAGIWMKHGGQKRFTGYKEFGGASSCTQAGLEAFLVDIPWNLFFYGTQAQIPANVLATVFKLDMWDIQRAVRIVYKATRHKLEFIADRVRQRRRTC